MWLSHHMTVMALMTILRHQQFTIHCMWNKNCDGKTRHPPLLCYMIRRQAENCGETLPAYMIIEIDANIEPQLNIYEYEYELHLLWSSDILWHHKTRSPLIKVRVFNLVAPSYYLNQSWPIINEVMWYSLVRNCTGNAQDISPLYQFETY